MEKLKIGAVEFDLKPMGISEDTIQKTRSFKVVKIMEFNDMRATMLEGMNQIDHIGNDGNIANSYMDCVALKYLGQGYLEEQDTYIIVLSTDANRAAWEALQRENTELRERVTLTEDALNELLLGGGE